MNVAIYGATGFLGLKLIEAILEQTDWNITAVGRNPSKITDHGLKDPRLATVTGDVSRYDDVGRTLQNIDVAYYFVHMMGRKDVDFYQAELSAAKNFIAAINQSSVRRVVYMGGLGGNRNSTSRHLRSRHLTGEIMRRSFDNVIELRASMIIGNGSVAYDIIRNVVSRLPVMVLPTASNTRTQPIALKDAIAYLLAAATVETNGSVAIDIGGPDILSYADIYKLYAARKNKKTVLFKFPYIPNAASALFLNLMTPAVHARIGNIMSESMTTEMLVTNESAKVYFPAIKPVPIGEAMDIA